VAALLIALVLLATMAYVQYASLNQLSSENRVLQSKYGQLLSWTASTDKAITFLEDVIQIDLTDYHSTLLSDTVEHRTDVGFLEEILRYSLTDSESQMDVVLRFRNSKLSMYQINLYEGSLLYGQPQSLSILDAAKNLLQRYRSYTNTSYLEEMSNMLASVNGTGNTEITENNIKLKIAASGADTQIQWLYTENGVDFDQKSLTLVFEDRVLKRLTDGWFLFSVGSTDVNIPSGEAIAIARHYLRGFTWTADGVTVSEFNVLQEPVLVVFHPIPREEPLALIPYWYITLYLDKVYPGNVNSIAVGVWADNGEVAQVKTLSG
jgi:hypothetical protein